MLATTASAVKNPRELLMATSNISYAVKDFHWYDEHVFVVPTLGRFTNVNKTVTGPPAEVGASGSADSASCTVCHPPRLPKRIINISRRFVKQTPRLFASRAVPGYGYGTH
jgi:hypothetical protein